MTGRSPFRPAEQVEPKAKCLIYGGPGVGKTYLCLTAPGPIAVIDTEGGTAFYAKRIGEGGLSSFDVLPTKTFRHVTEALDWLAANPDAYKTLVIDPVTVLYETLQEAASDARVRMRNNPDADLEMLDWQRIKRAYKRLMTDLVNLPLHVLVTAREKELMEGKGEARHRVGFGADAEKGTAYYFDTVLRLVGTGGGNREAIVEKDRTGSFDLDARILAPTFDIVFGRAIAVGGTVARQVQSDEEAANIDSQTTLSAQPWAVGHAEVTGKVAVGRSPSNDGLLRTTGAGQLMGFQIHVEDGPNVAQAWVRGDLAEAVSARAVATGPKGLKGQVVTAEGELWMVPFTKDGMALEPFRRLEISSIRGADWALPVSDPVSIPVATDAAFDELADLEGAPPAQPTPEQAGQPAEAPEGAGDAAAGALPTALTAEDFTAALEVARVAVTYADAIRKRDFPAAKAVEDLTDEERAALFAAAVA